MATVQEVAHWMAKRLKEEKSLYQPEVVDSIRLLFGDHFIFKNLRDGLSINSRVLRAFTILMDGNVIYQRIEATWYLIDEQGKKVL